MTGIGPYTQGLHSHSELVVGLDFRQTFYAFRKVSSSALMVSASVVGMPCGKPL